MEKCAIQMRKILPSYMYRSSDTQVSLGKRKNSVSALAYTSLKREGLIHRIRPSLELNRNTLLLKFCFKLHYPSFEITLLFRKLFVVLF